MTYYLKYRPQTIKDLDLEAARKELEAILASGRFSHAYLFSGPRGTGKTSSARILAKVVNCIGSKEKLNEPCNKCSACRQVMNGSFLDLVEIDAASNRGIDDIRELRERIKLSPTEARYKVYIIDEVHMLTNEAFNALLKTLEEPPEHALFILCTTQPEKLPDTIVSRCTRIGFPKASQEEVLSSLKKVVKGEKLKLKDGVLQLISESVDGSFRDGMKILEQLSLRSAGKKGKKRIINTEDAQEVIGLSETGVPRAFVELIASGDYSGALEFVGELGKRKASLEQFMREVLDLLRRLMLAEAGIMKEEKIDNLDMNALKRLIVLFNRASRELKTAVIPELSLEIAVVEWFQEVKKGKGKENRASGKGEGADSGGKNQNPGKRKKVDLKFSQIKSGWPKVLERVRPQNHSLEALLKAAVPMELVDRSLIVEVAYPFHKEQLELSRYKSMVEKAIFQVFSTKLRLKYTLRKFGARAGNAKREEHENLSGDVGDEKVIKVAEEVFGVESE